MSILWRKDNSSHRYSLFGKCDVTVTTVLRMTYRWVFWIANDSRFVWLTAKGHKVGDDGVGRQLEETSEHN
jgi:hypothetical protein